MYATRGGRTPSVCWRRSAMMSATTCWPRLPICCLEETTSRPLKGLISHTDGWFCEHTSSELLYPNKLCSDSLMSRELENVLLYSWNPPGLHLPSRHAPRSSSGSFTCRRPHRFTSSLSASLASRSQKHVPKNPLRWPFKKNNNTLRDECSHPEMFLMSCGVLNVKVYIYVATRLPWKLR